MEGYTYGHKWNYIYICTLKSNDILNALAEPVYYFTEYTSILFTEWNILLIRHSKMWISNVALKILLQLVMCCDWISTADLCNASPKVEEPSMVHDKSAPLSTTNIFRHIRCGNSLWFVFYGFLYSTKVATDPRCHDNTQWQFLQLRYHEITALVQNVKVDPIWSFALWRCYSSLVC
jgi:hypothetical protein